jgi:hypothetical protein
MSDLGSRDSLVAVLAVAASRRDALVRLGIPNPRPPDYRRLEQTCRELSLSLPAPVLPDRERAEKHCGGCRQLLPIAAFALQNRATGRRQSRCRQCRKGLRRDHYVRNKGRVIAQVAEWKRQNWTKYIGTLLAFFRDHPCVDCGETDPVVLQFDPVTGIKTANVSEMMRRQLRWERVEAEIAKCAVRCANCHSRKTARDFGHRRAILARQTQHVPRTEELA